MQLTFLGNRYQRSQYAAEVIPTGQEGMYRGSHYTPTHAPSQPSQDVHLRYRGVQYDR